MKLKIKNLNSLHIKTALLTATLLVLFAQCSNDFESPAVPTGSTIGEIVSSSDDFDILVAALNKTGLYNTLNNTNAGQFTLFAPNDAAFLVFLQSPAAFNVVLTEEEAITKINEMTNSTPSSTWNSIAFALRLNYHILSSELKSSEITGAKTQTTLSIPSSTSGAARLSLSVVGADVLVNANTTANGAKVIAVDADASNGVMHTIDRVLTAPTTSSALTFLGVTINYGVNPPAVSVSAVASNYNVMAAAIKRAQIATVLQPNISPLPDFTIFAPTDAAFITYLGAADEAAAITIINSMDVTALASLLYYHVVSGRVLTSDLTDEEVVTTLLTDETFTMNIVGSVYTIKDNRDANELNDPIVTAPNTLTNAGVVHTVNTVLQYIPD